MRTRPGAAVLAALLLSWGCAKSVLVSVPPRMDLRAYETLGIVEFASNEGRVEALATRRFQEQTHAAQPGTPFVELGSRAAVLAAVGRSELDRQALRAIGEKYGVDAVFVGDLRYSAPKTDVRVIDISKLEGNVRTEIRADMSVRLLDTRSGASVWSSSSWARRKISDVHVSGAYGVKGGVRTEKPHEEMLSDLVYHVTEDFRPGTVRQRVE